MPENPNSNVFYTAEQYPSYHNLLHLKDGIVVYDKRWLTWGQSNVTFDQLNNKLLKEYR